MVLSRCRTWLRVVRRLGGTDAPSPRCRTPTAAGRRAWHRGASACKAVLHDAQPRAAVPAAVHADAVDRAGLAAGRDQAVAVLAAGGATPREPPLHAARTA